MVFEQMQKNTVRADNQLNDTKQVRFFNPTGKGCRVMMIGNSITLHCVKPDIGWHGEWGMAASAPEKDYFHRVMQHVQTVDADAAFCLCQVAGWELKYKTGGEDREMFRAAREFGADVLVMRFVENCAVEDLQPDAFYHELGRFLDFLDSTGQAHRVLTTGFWRHPLDDTIRRYAADHGFALVELGDLGEDDGMKAIGLFQHSGVANHPNDHGMEHIAARIWDAMRVWF